MAHELNITLKYLMAAFNKINKHFYFLIFRRFFWDRQSAWTYFAFQKDISGLWITLAQLYEAM